VLLHRSFKAAIDRRRVTLFRLESDKDLVPAGAISALLEAPVSAPISPGFEDHDLLAN
jgi:hypothetical protein